MDIVKFKTVLADNVIAPMIQFMEEWSDDCEFTKKDVQKCEKILTKYLDSLASLSAPSDKDIMKCVKRPFLH